MPYSHVTPAAPNGEVPALPQGEIDAQVLTTILGEAYLQTAKWASVAKAQQQIIADLRAQLAAQPAPDGGDRSWVMGDGGRGTASPITHHPSPRTPVPPSPITHHLPT